MAASRIAVIALSVAFVLMIVGYIYMATQSVAIPEKYDTIAGMTLTGLLGLLVKSPTQNP
jgi:hypothetical protein